jgi:hypothetical protein
MERGAIRDHYYIDRGTYTTSGFFLEFISFWPKFSEEEEFSVNLPSEQEVRRKLGILFFKGFSFSPLIR